MPKEYSSEIMRLTAHSLSQGCQHRYIALGPRCIAANPGAEVQPIRRAVRTLWSAAGEPDAWT